MVVDIVGVGISLVCTFVLIPFKDGNIKWKDYILLDDLELVQQHYVEFLLERRKTQPLFVYQNPA